MQVYNFRPMDVKSYFKPALTTEDFDRLDAAHAYYADAGKGYHTFAQVCSRPDCTGYWCITISETDPMFRGAIDRAVSGGLCRACQDAQRVAMPSLITYRAKSADAGASGGSGGSRGRSHRNRQSGAGSKRETIAAYKRWIAEDSDWLQQVADGLIDATPEMIAHVKGRIEDYTAIVAAYSRKAVA